MDYGGANDGRCEWSFFTRCTHKAVMTVTFGQQNGWTYRYCGPCGHRVLQHEYNARRVQ